MDDERKARFVAWLVINRENCKPNNKTIDTYAENIRRIEKRITADFEIAIRGEEQIMINLDELDRDEMLRLYRWFEYTKEDVLAGRPPRQHIRDFRLNKIGSTDGYRNSINIYSRFRGHGDLHNRQRRN